MICRILIGNRNRILYHIFLRFLDFIFCIHCMHNTTTVTSLDGIECKKNYDFVDKQTFRFDIQTNTVKIYSTAPPFCLPQKTRFLYENRNTIFFFFLCTKIRIRKVVRNVQIIKNLKNTNYLSSNILVFFFCNKYSFIRRIQKLRRPLLPKD